MNPLYGLAFSYGDCVLNANIPSLLGGMNDARLEKYATTNADGDFFGIRNGVKGLEEGKNSDNYKAIVSKPNLVATSPAILATAGETILLEAEAALRGWNVNGKGTAKDLYEKGVKASFEQWGAAVGDYLSGTTTAAAYVDPIIPAASIEGQSKVTAQWDESLSNEEKFAKIATQRWIAVYPEGMNGWAELRRTGYPKLFPVMVNYSQGEIDTDLGPRRLPFTINEKNEFERELTDAGTVVVKFWVQIDKDTQLARFRERQNTPEKQWKITEEDWRNREKWDAYEEAVDEMLARTSTERAPWHILESVDKRYARIKAMRLVIGAIRQTLDR